MPWYNKVASSSAATSINQQTKLAGEFNLPRFVLARSFRRRRFARRETNKRTLRTSAFASELFSRNCTTLGAAVGGEGGTVLRDAALIFLYLPGPMQNQHKRNALLFILFHCSWQSNINILSRLLPADALWPSK
jgi:hypothetical protein